MSDDPGDIDRNGIPDAIQRDPVIVPEEPITFGAPTEEGLPGITAPIEATAEPLPLQPPVMPPPPPEGADEAAMAEYEREMATYQEAMQHYSLMTSTLSNIANMKHESLKSIAQNLRG